MSLIINEDGTGRMHVPIEQVSRKSEIHGGGAVVELSKYDVMSMFEIVLRYATQASLEAVAKETVPGL